MDVLECAQDLVEEVLAVVVRERLRRGNDLVEVRVHELRHNVHVVEAVVRDGPQDVPGSGGWVGGWREWVALMGGWAGGLVGEVGGVRWGEVGWVGCA